MPDEQARQLGMYDKIQRLEQAMFDDDGKFEKLRSRVGDLEHNDKWQDRELKNVNDTLRGIQEDTKWLRRTITTAIIGTLSTGVIGGAIALVWATIGQ